MACRFLKNIRPDVSYDILGIGIYMHIYFINRIHYYELKFLFIFFFVLLACVGETLSIVARNEKGKLMWMEVDPKDLAN